MSQTEHLSMKLSPEDKQALQELAQHLHRSQTDTVRTLIRETLVVIRGKDAEKPESAGSGRKAVG